MAINGNAQKYMANILIADSGSTKTDWCLIEGGQCELSVTTQGINPFHQKGEEIECIINDELLPRIEGRAVEDVHFYGSGCREELCPAVEGILRHVFPQAESVEVASDLLGAARALCHHEEGVACILGTGANSCLFDGERIVANTPPLGYILGDEGSGAVLGRTFINAVYKGLLPKELKASFESELQLTMNDVVHRVYCEPLANRFLASLSPFIHRNLCVDGVRELVVSNFQEFFRRNVASYGRRDLPVGFVGSMAVHYESELSEAATVEGFRVGRILDSPIRALSSFHICVDN